MLCDQIQQVLIYHLYSTFGEKSRGAVRLSTTHPLTWSRSGIVFTILCFMCHGGVNWCVVIPPPSCCCKCLKMCQKCAFAWLAYLPAVILLEELRSSPQEVHSQSYPCLDMLSGTQSVLLLEKVDLERVLVCFLTSISVGIACSSLMWASFCALTPFLRFAQSCQPGLWCICGSILCIGGEWDLQEVSSITISKQSAFLAI